MTLIDLWAKSNYFCGNSHKLANVNHAKHNLLLISQNSTFQQKFPSDWKIESFSTKWSLSYSFPHAEKNCLLFGKKLRKILEALKWHEFVYIFSSIKKCMILKTLDFDALHSSLNRNMCLSNNEKNYAFINYGTLQDQRSFLFPSRVLCIVLPLLCLVHVKFISVMSKLPNIL